MWVRLLEWMIADAEPPMRTVGSMLTGVGIRVRGEVTTARPESPDGIVEIQGGAPFGHANNRLPGRRYSPTLRSRG
jgi:hypothetical protein